MYKLYNNRVVANDLTGMVEQTVAYYPYGGVIPTLGNPTGGHSFKFGGKELVTANGLNVYDFGARGCIILAFPVFFFWKSHYLMQ